jgi:hypothetical protein
MIERPKRSVTRFFVPLIDVLILLFCIFLLMPFVATPAKSEPDAKPKAKTPEPELPRDVRELQEELQRTRREVDRLKAERGNLAERLSVKVLDMDPTGNLYYYTPDGKHLRVENEAMARALITQHRQASGTKEPFFLLLFPRPETGYPRAEQAKAYAEWFKDVQFQFDRPFAP